MGEARNNSIAILAAEPHTQPEYGFGWVPEIQVIPNEETQKMLESAIEIAKNEGRDPRTVAFRLTPDQQDLVVFSKIAVQRKTSLAVDPSRIPTVQWNHSILFRTPLKPLIDRYEQAMSDQKDPGKVG